jgi:hypothetical protein
MLALIVFFFVGVLLGMIGLRLLRMWEPDHTVQPPSNSVQRHHP